jgi:hypothetical protein
VRGEQRPSGADHLVQQRTFGRIGGDGVDPA